MLNKPQQPKNLQSDVNNRFLSRPNEGLMFGGSGPNKTTYSGGVSQGDYNFQNPTDEDSYWANDKMYQEMLAEAKRLEGLNNPSANIMRNQLLGRMQQYRQNKFNVPKLSATATPPTTPTSQAPAASNRPAAAPQPTATTPSAPPPQTPNASGVSTTAAGAPGGVTMHSNPAASAGSVTAANAGGSTGQVNTPPQSGNQTSTSSQNSTPNQPATTPPAGATPGNGLWTSLQEAQKLLMEHQDLRRPDRVGPYNHSQGQTDEWNRVNLNLRARIDYINKQIKKVQTTADKTEVKERNARQAKEAEIKETERQAVETKAQTQAQATQSRMQGLTQQGKETQADDVMKKAGALLADQDITQEQFDLLTQDPARATEVVNRMFSKKYRLSADGTDPQGNQPGVTTQDDINSRNMWNQLVLPPTS